MKSLKLSKDLFAVFQNVMAGNNDKFLFSNFFTLSLSKTLISLRTFFIQNLSLSQATCVYVEYKDLALWTNENIRLKYFQNMLAFLVYLKLSRISNFVISIAKGNSMAELWNVILFATLPLSIIPFPVWQSIDGGSPLKKFNPAVHLCLRVDF